MIQIFKADGSIKNGTVGLSAYQIWLNDGNTGTESDFLDSLVGPTGPTGSGASGNYTHTQAVPATTWTIVHNLGFNPAGVAVFDSSDRNVIGDIDHIDLNTLTVTFAAGFSGIAYIS